MPEASSTNNSNHSFYEAQAESFSLTRQQPWEGWFQLFPLIRNLDENSIILDLGCGNGRFGAFCAKYTKTNPLYIGVDFSDALISLAKKANLSPLRTKFITADLSDSKTFHSIHEVVAVPSNDTSLSQPSHPSQIELICIFGVLHHLNRQERVELLKNCHQILSPTGKIICSFWQPLLSPRIRNQWNLPLTDIHQAKDGVMGWKDSEDKRTVHHFSSSEITHDIENSDLKLRACFSADSPNRLNIYTILEK